MEIVENVLLVLHFLGFAAILHGFLTQTRARTKQVNAAVLHGALTQLVTGLALVGVNEALDEEVDNVTVGIKLVALLVITAIAVWGRRRPSVPTGAWVAIGALTVLNVVVAVFR